MTLSEFLLARIAEDEAVAHEVHAEHLRIDDPCTEPSLVLVEDSAYPWVGASPARVLAECESKRRIVELHQGWGYVERDSYADQVVRLLALPYADHPDYREEWRP